LSTGVGVAGGSETGSGAGEFWENATEQNPRNKVRRPVADHRGNDAIMKKDLQTRHFKVNDFRDGCECRRLGALQWL
jgi:hypothetical protein